MNEFMGQLPRKVVEKAKEVSRDKIAPKIISALSRGSLEPPQDFALRHLEDLGIQPVFYKKVILYLKTCEED